MIGDNTMGKPIIMTSAVVDNTNDYYKFIVKHAVDNNIKKIVLFAKRDSDAPYHLNKMLDNHNIQMVCVFFPANETIYFEKDGSIARKIDNDTTVKRNPEPFKAVYGTMPLDSTIVPGTSNDVFNAIKRALGLFSPSTQLAIQAAAMATDAGAAFPKERLIAMASDIALDLNAANARLLFHPTLGLKINQIIVIKNKKADDR